MRKIENKKIEMPFSKMEWKNDKILKHELLSEKTSYFELFKLAAETPPPNGWNTESVSTLGKRLSLLKVLSKSNNEELLIEEEDYNTLKDSLKGVLINSTSQDAYDFFNYLNTIEKIENV